MHPYFLGEKLIVDPAGGAFAVVSNANILGPHSDLILDSRPNPAINVDVMWSGWVGDSIFARDFRAWGKEAWSRLDAWCDSHLPDLAAEGRTICFRPHPRHTLSDAQSCVSFLNKRAGQPFQLLLDPVGLLTPTMLPRAEDHLNRVLEALADHPGVAGVIVSNAVASPDDPDLLVSCPVHRGVLESRLVHIIASRVPAEKPFVLHTDDAAAQVAFLHASGAAPR